MKIEKFEEIMENIFALDWKQEDEEEFFSENILEEKFFYKGFIKNVISLMFDGLEDNIK